MAAIINGVEDGIDGRSDIVLGRRFEINFKRNEVFDTIPEKQWSYDSLTCVVLLLHGTYGWFVSMYLQDSPYNEEIVEEIAANVLRLAIVLEPNCVHRGTLRRNFFNNTSSTSEVKLNVNVFHTLFKAK